MTKRICCNAECNWIGEEYECVVFKHDATNPTYFMCPICNESTEEILNRIGKEDGTQ